MRGLLDDLYFPDLVEFLRRSIVRTNHHQKSIDHLRLRALRGVNLFRRLRKFFQISARRTRVSLSLQSLRRFAFLAVVMCKPMTILARNPPRTQRLIVFTHFAIRQRTPRAPPPSLENQTYDSSARASVACHAHRRPRAFASSSSRRARAAHRTRYTSPPQPHHHRSTPCATSASPARTITNHRQSRRPRSRRSIVPPRSRTARCRSASSPLASRVPPRVSSPSSPPRPRRVASRRARKLSLKITRRAPRASSSSCAARASSARARLDARLDQCDESNRRVAIGFGRRSTRSVDRSVGRSVDRSIGRSIGRRARDRRIRTPRWLAGDDRRRSRSSWR